MNVHELAAGVYVISTTAGDARGDSNFGLITTSQGSVLIDADVRRWQEGGDLIRPLLKSPLAYLINTHHHYDHTSANQVLERQGVTIISSRACRDKIATMAGGLRQKLAEEPAAAALQVQEVALPRITDTGGMRLYLDGRVLELRVMGHAHTSGDLVVYLPAEQVLFTGDVLFHNCHPVTGEADTGNWMAILEQLASWNIALTVPGHGEPATGHANINALRQYFIILREKVAHMAASGMDLEAAVREFSLPGYEGWGKKNWLPASVQKVYGEIRDRNKE